MLEQIRRNASEIMKEETRMTLFDPMAFTDGPFSRAKQDPALKEQLPIMMSAEISLVPVLLNGPSSPFS